MICISLKTIDKHTRCGVKRAFHSAHSKLVIETSALRFEISIKPVLIDRGTVKENPLTRSQLDDQRLMNCCCFAAGKGFSGIVVLEH